MTPNKLPTNIDFRVSSFIFVSGDTKGLKAFLVSDIKEGLIRILVFPISLKTQNTTYDRNTERG